MQLILVITILTAAVAYSGWRIYNAIRHANDPCYGCNGCQLKNLKNKACTKKK